MANIRKHVVISGRVQGVFFRADTREQALIHGVTGWVRNTFDGNVEAVFEGEEEDVAKVIQWCHHGPPGARVEEVRVKDEQYVGEFLTFSIRYF